MDLVEDEQRGPALARVAARRLPLGLDPLRAGRQRKVGDGVPRRAGPALGDLARRGGLADLAWSRDDLQERRRAGKPLEQGPGHGADDRLHIVILQQIETN